MDHIVCHHEKLADIRFQDGGLRHVIGACNYQVVRATKNALDSPEGRGFTYNHAPMLAYWKNHFFYEYLGGPKGEHETPSAAFLCISKDGIHWGKPIEIFPPASINASYYRGPKKEKLEKEKVSLVVHHRMGFYTAMNGRLLVSTFYGICPDSHVAPNNGYGVGRVVREIYSDLTMSEIYFIRYNEAGGYGKEQVDLFKEYKSSPDSGFIDACEDLLKNQLVTQQWWEEERLDQDFFTRPDGKALSYYTLKDGRVMGVFKEALTSITKDGGKSWSPIKKSPTLITSTGKVWGQRMPDGNYALVYNPSPDSAHRWPLAITTGENGQDFYDLAAIVPEISPCRYEGVLKNLGAQYMRGITEANEKPKDFALWIAYSVNKEDLWIARVPNPVETVWKGDIHDDMSSIREEVLRNTWNLYVPSWGQAKLDEVDSKRGLLLSDYDPYNRVRAERIYEPTDRVHLILKGMVLELRKEKITISIQSSDGQNLVQIVFDADKRIAVHNGGLDQLVGNYLSKEEIVIDLKIDCREFTYELEILQGTNRYHKKGNIVAAVTESERLVVSTKYTLPFQGLEVNGRNGEIGNLEGADQKHPKTSFCLYSLDVMNENRR